MANETKAWVTIEILVEVTGSYARAEPDVGMNEGYFEDAYISRVNLGKVLDAAEIEYEVEIQEALGEQMQSDGEREYESD